MRILVVTNFYPEPERPIFGLFVRQQVDALRRLGVEANVFKIRKWGRSVFGYLFSSVPLALTFARSRPDVIHAHFGLAVIPLLPFLWLARWLRIPVVATYHGTDVLGPSWLIRELSSLGASRVDVAVGVSKQICEELEKSAKRVIYLPCGIDTSFFSVPRSPEYRQLILFPSDPRRPEKNYARFQVVVRRCEEIIGGKVPTLCLQGISRTEVRSLLSTASCLLMTSDYEGSPQIVKEAIVCGLPVVSTDVGDVRFLVGSLEHCLVSNSDEELAMAVANAVRRRARTVPPNDVVAALDENAVASRLVALYGEL